MVSGRQKGQFELEKWVLSETNISIGAKSLYAYLYELSNTYEELQISTEYFQNVFGISYKTLLSYINELKAYDYIETGLIQSNGAGHYILTITKTLLKSA